MSFRAAALTVALAAAMLAAVPPAQAAEPGVVPDLNWGTSTADQDRTAAAIRDVGARWVRLHVQWKYWEPNGPLADVVDNGSRRSTDRAVQLARGAGAKVIVMVYNAPAWAAARTSSEGSTPRDPAEYAAFVRRLAAHYRGQVEAYEVWNEPDLQRFWAGGPNPTAYT
ncbi:MAG TPA: cellulase family glycosylhydrolase, partial [Gaiellaceae bacterium]|nr:cellulase family glycosylhydrolase [Gaiellaceae bacterium]